VLGCYGRRALALAEIVAATVLCGELSLGSAIAADEWVSSHDAFGRNRRRTPRREGYRALSLPRWGGGARGTIASTQHANGAGVSPGLEASDLVGSVPELAEVAVVEAEAS